MWVAIVLAMLALLTALAAGLALGLHLFLPQWSERRRIRWSALVAVLVPMSVPLGGFLYEAPELLAEGGQDFVLGGLALICFTLIVTAVICLPSAWFVTTRLARGTGGGHAGRIAAGEEEEHLAVQA